MIIALFGITCVGKTTIGKIISETLGYCFYDLDAEIISYYKDTIEHIQKSCFNRNDYDDKKAAALKNILGRCGKNTIIAMSPIYYTIKYKKMFRDNHVLSIELQDSPENIAKRLIYTDENDVVIVRDDIDIKRNMKEDIRDMKYFISYYKKAFSKIENKYNIDGKSAAEAAIDVIDIIMTLERNQRASLG